MVRNVDLIQFAAMPSYNTYLIFRPSFSVQDCVETDPAPCGGNPSKELTLFDDAETCCEEKLSWLSLEVCVANTNGVAP